MIKDEFVPVVLKNFVYLGDWSSGPKYDYTRSKDFTAADKQALKDFGPPDPDNPK